MGNEKILDEKLLRDMFNTIRSAEIKNIKTRKKDDKAMVKSITNYINKTVGKEMESNEN